MPRNYDNLNGQSKVYFILTHPDGQTIKLWTKVIVGVLPAMVLGLLFDDLIDKYLFNPITVAAMLVIWGLIIILIERKNRGKEAFVYESLADVPYKIVLAIGFFQCLATVSYTHLEPTRQVR